MTNENDSEQDYAEFDLASIEIGEVDATAHIDSLDEVLQMRNALVRCEQKIFRMEQDFDKRDSEANRLAITGMQVAVELVDELGRLVAAATSNTESGEVEEADDTPSDDNADEAGIDSWLQAFRRLSVAAAHTMEEQLSIVQVPLQGSDIREVSVEDQAVSRWVAVKKSSQDAGYTVREEIRGLWVRSTGGKLIPIQRGEVIT